MAAQGLPLLYPFLKFMLLPEASLCKGIYYVLSRYYPDELTILNNWQDRYISTYKEIHDILNCCMGRNRYGRIADPVFCMATGHKGLCTEFMDRSSLF